jgi:hypothetical protein
MIRKFFNESSNRKPLGLGLTKGLVINMIASFGSPAVLRLAYFLCQPLRPVTLRPRLSPGLPFLRGTTKVLCLCSPGTTMNLLGCYTIYVLVYLQLF